MAGGAADCFYLSDFLSRHIVPTPPLRELALLLSSALYSRRTSDPNAGLSVGTMLSGFERLPFYLASPTDDFYPPEPAPGCEPSHPGAGPLTTHLLPLVTYLDNSGRQERVFSCCVGSGGDIASSILDVEVARLSRKHDEAAREAGREDADFELRRRNVCVVATHEEALDAALKAVSGAARRDGYSGGIVQAYQIRSGRGKGKDEVKWRRVRVVDVGGGGVVNGA
jgi:20S proteasome alpha/beta subunit